MNETQHDGDEFEGLVSRVMELADPAPPEVIALAKLAYDFRDVETLEVIETGELTGVRSQDPIVMSLASGEVQLVWSIEDERLVGTISGYDDGLLELQTASKRGPIDVGEGLSFEHEIPHEPYRFVLTIDGRAVASAWMAGAF